MTLSCGHCSPKTRRAYPLEDYSVKRRESFVLLSGHQLRFAAKHRVCGWTTLLQHLPSPARDRMAAEVKA